MRRRIVSCALGAILALLGTAHAAGDAEVGRIKADSCMGCHGVPTWSNVYPTYHVPRLAGQHADYIVLALKAYQSGKRKHSTMHAQALKLSDEDMADIAAYLTAAGQ